MEMTYIETNEHLLIAEVTGETLLISRTQDVLDIFGELIGSGCERLIIHERSLHPDFFDLKTRLAGDILQKFSNYRVKLAIVGDFAKFGSRSLKDFISESNKTGVVFFTESIDLAIEKFSKY